MHQRLRTSLVLAILPNFHHMWKFVENLVLTQVQIFMECMETQILRISIDWSSTPLWQSLISLVNNLTAIRVPAGTKKLTVVLFLGRYVPMAVTIFTFVDCFLCDVSGDLVSFNWHFC